MNQNRIFKLCLQEHGHIFLKGLYLVSVDALSSLLLYFTINFHLRKARKSTEDSVRKGTTYTSTPKRKDERWRGWL